MMVVDNKFEITQIVYLKTDTEQKPRIVTGIRVQKDDVCYELGCGTDVSVNYDFEISETKDILITSDN